MQIQLEWIDPATNGLRRPQYETPIAIGRDFSQLPSELSGQRVSRLALDDPSLQPYHGVLKANALGELAIALCPEATTAINGQLYTGETIALQSGDRLQLGALELTITILSAPASAAPDRAWGATVASETPEVAGLAAASAASGAAPAVEGACNRLVGFLFPRRCGRTSRENCPHCRGGEIDDDPYFLASERSVYRNYGYYGGNAWGSEYTEDLAPAGAEQSGDPSAYDFTEADAAAFAVTATDFEQDLEAS